MHQQAASTEHVLFWMSEDGQQTRRFADLGAAAEHVEHLRNDLGITEVELHRLTPVKLSFRTYFRVELEGALSTTPLAASPRPMPPVNPFARDEDEADQPAPAFAVAANEDGPHLHAVPDESTDAESNLQPNYPDASSPFTLTVVPETAAPLPPLSEPVSEPVTEAASEAMPPVPAQAAPAAGSSHSLGLFA